MLSANEVDTKETQKLTEIKIDYSAQHINVYSFSAELSFPLQQ